MTRDATQPILTVVLVDYDNIYLALRKRSEEAAKRFARDAVSWIREIESGRLLSATNSPGLDAPRRIVVNRCYGNPVPRRNPQDNSTDMTSFPFVRHHFLRAGFEVVDCPPLTAQLKNSSDIKMVMDANDMIAHATHFHEFIILSGDADFTPLLHRLRAHNRRSVIFANDYTAAAYKAICDAEIKETTLMSVLLEPASAAEPAPMQQSQQQTQTQTAQRAQALVPAAQTTGSQVAAAAPVQAEINLERLRAEIIASVVVAVKGAGGPVPLETLAERTTRALGHDRTVGTSWAGAGGFLELLRRHLPADIALTAQPPYLAYEAARVLAAPAQAPMPPLERRQAEPVHAAPAARTAAQPLQTEPQPLVAQGPPVVSQPLMPRHEFAAPAAAQHAPQRSPAPQQQVPATRSLQTAPAQRPETKHDMAAAIQASIARIHEACQAPPLSPPDYRALFDAIAREITEGGLQGAQTLANIHARTQQAGLSVSRDDVKFVVEVVSEADPWFEQGVSPVLFAGRFRNFVVARCRGAGLNLSSDELDLIDAWFAGGGQQVSPQSIRPPAQEQPVARAQPHHQQAPSSAAEEPIDQFPKILRTRLRG